MKSKEASEILQSCNVDVYKLSKDIEPTSGGISELHRILAAMEEYANQSKWVSVETPPKDEFWYRVLIDSKHHIMPFSFVGKDWWCYGESHPTDLNVTHYQAFEDLT